MKKSILILSTLIITLSLMAFSYMNWNNNHLTEIELGYNIDSRFTTTITKEDLNKAKSVLDIVPEVAEGWWEVSFQTITVAVIRDWEEIREIGNDKTLNEEQIKLLQSADYSTNFYIKARGKDKHPDTGKIEDYVYHFTIIPEQEAEYAGGIDALTSYLKKYSKEESVNITEDKLKRGMISFTVTKTGTIENVKLNSTSGYSSYDETMVKLITNMPEKWKPATNLKEEKVDQELVFFFGLIGGC